MTNTFHSGDVAALLNQAAAWRGALLHTYLLFALGNVRLEGPAWRNAIDTAKDFIASARYTRLENTAPQGWLIVRS